MRKGNMKQYLKVKVLVYNFVRPYTPPYIYIYIYIYYMLSYNRVISLHDMTVSGKRNGKGYYIYEKGSKPKPDPLVLPIIEESIKLANLMPEGKVRKEPCTNFYSQHLELNPSMLDL